MSSAIHGDKRCQVLHMLQAMACTVALLLAAGCPVVPGVDDNSNGDNGTIGNDSDGPVTAEIVNVSRTIQISELEVPLSILYAVNASESAVITSFFVPVGGGDADRVDITTTSPLVPGSGQFPFDPSQTGVGAFRVGMVVVDGDETVTVISDGLIQVEGRPSPVFIQTVRS